MHRIFSLGLLVIALSSCSTISGSRGMPEPAHSDYFITKGGSFALRRDDHRVVVSCHYSLRLAPRQVISHPLYLRTAFENPADVSHPLITEMDVKPGAGDIYISSPEVAGLQSGSSYKAEVSVFDTPDRVHQVGKHIQYIRYTKPNFVQ